MTLTTGRFLHLAGRLRRRTPHRWLEDNLPRPLSLAKQRLSPLRGLDQDVVGVEKLFLALVPDLAVAIPIVALDGVQGLQKLEVDLSLQFLGKAPAPQSVTSGGITVHIWTEGQIEEVRRLLPKIANGRKTRYQNLRDKQKRAHIEPERCAKNRAFWQPAASKNLWFDYSVIDW